MGFFQNFYFDKIKKIYIFVLGVPKVLSEGVNQKLGKVQKFWYGLLEVFWSKEQKTTEGSAPLALTLIISGRGSTFFVIKNKNLFDRSYHSLSKLFFSLLSFTLVLSAIKLFPGFDKKSPYRGGAI